MALDNIENIEYKKQVLTNIIQLYKEQNKISQVSKYEKMLKEIE